MGSPSEDWMKHGNLREGGKANWDLWVRLLEAMEKHKVFFGSGLKHTMAILRTKLSMGRPRKPLGDTMQMQMQAIKEELSRIIGHDYAFQHKVTGNKVTILLVSHRFEKSCLERECLELEIKGMISRNLPKGMVLDLYAVPGERPSVPPYYIGGCI